jgi:hypothetical protein
MPLAAAAPGWEEEKKMYSFSVAPLSRLYVRDKMLDRKNGVHKKTLIGIR